MLVCWLLFSSVGMCQKISSEFSQRKYDLAIMTLEMDQGDDGVSKLIALRVAGPEFVVDLPCNHIDLKLIPEKLLKSSWALWPMLTVSATGRQR